MIRRPSAARPPSQRSAVTNGSRVLHGVDGNSPLARRYRDLVELLSADLGDGLTEAERLIVRNAATMHLHAEDLTARLVRGESVDPEAITRAANGATRALSALRRRQGGRRAAVPIRDVLAARKGAAR